MKKILVVDDEVLNRKLAGDTLKSGGFEVIEAEDGNEGIYLAKKELPDLVLLDLAMPDVDGIETCRRFKEIEKIKHIPIVMLSAMNEAKLIDLALAAGAIDYLTKPVSPSELLAKTKKHIA